MLCCPLTPSLRTSLEIGRRPEFPLAVQKQGLMEPKLGEEKGMLEAGPPPVSTSGVVEVTV